MKDNLLKWMAYSVSAHNSQPFRLGQKGADFFVSVDPTRILPSADPKNKDLLKGLGCLLQVWEIFLASLEHEIKILRLQTDPIAKMPQVLLEFQIQKSSPASGGIMQNPWLLDALRKRFSYRGAFHAKDLKNFSVQHPDSEIKSSYAFLNNQLEVKQVAGREYDKINQRSLCLPGYIEELYEWLRFDPTHARWSLDGLNTQAMSISGFEAAVGKRLMSPKTFRRLEKMGLFPLIFSEAGKIKNSAGLWVIHCPKGTNRVEQGKIFLRQWLELYRWGLFGAPLSILMDYEDSLKAMQDSLAIPADQEIINILRVGPLPQNFTTYPAARKSLEESFDPSSPEKSQHG